MEYLSFIWDSLDWKLFSPMKSKAPECGLNLMFKPFFYELYLAVLTWIMYNTPIENFSQKWMIRMRKLTTMDNMR